MIATASVRMIEGHIRIFRFEATPPAKAARLLAAELDRIGVDFCPTCGELVESDGRLDADGIYAVCPHCETEVA